MWQQLWKKWTIDKPAALGDWLWDVFVVQFAAFLNGLTWRHVIILLPLIAVFIAYNQGIPVPPQFALAGDVLASIDVFSALFLLGVLSRATTLLYLARQAASRALRLVSRLQMMVRRPDVRHGREGGAQNGSRSGNRAQNNEEDPAAFGNCAWA
jgi:hypothetical protein